MFVEFVQVRVFNKNDFSIFATTKNGGLMVKPLNHIETIYLPKKETFKFLHNPHQLWIVVEETWGKDENLSKVLVLKPFTLPLIF